MKTTRVVFYMGLLILSSRVAAHAQQYTIIDLGTLGGDGSYATSINNVGQIVGRAQVLDGSWRPFLWYEGAMQEISGDSDATPRRINDSGSMVGWSRCTSNASAFIWQNGQYTNLGSLGGYVTWAEAVNGFNQAVGSSDIYPGGPHHAFLWENGVMQDLGTLGYNPNTTYSEAYGINDLGYVVGETDTQDDLRAFVWKDGLMSRLILPDSWQDGAWAINNKGQVVGWIARRGASAQCEAFLWSNGVVQNLRTLPGHQKAFAVGINDPGQVVGVSQYGYSEHQPFLWENGHMYNLNDFLPANSGWILQGYWSIGGINNHGEIVGYGINPEGKSRGFLLVPTIENIPPERRDVTLRAPDGVFNNQHDISFVGDSLKINLKVRLTGVNPGEELKRTWEDGIERIWNNQYKVIYGGNDYSILMDVEFVEQGGDITVEVFEGDWDTDVDEWCTRKPAGWPFEYQDRFVAHEFGHMIGLYDEYYQGGRGTLDPENPFIEPPPQTSIMATLDGMPKERHFQSILEWLEGETGYDMVLAESPLWRPGESGPPVGDGSPVPEPTSIALLILGSAAILFRRRYR